jgi:hypothetical protein
MRRRSFPAVVAAVILLLAGANGAAQTDETLPAGHPPVGAANPHAGAEGAPGTFTPPQDEETPDAALPAGTIDVEVRDADGLAVPNEQVNLGILINSIAKGDSRKHVQATTDARGGAVFSDLEIATNTAYRVSVTYQGGLFAAAPFQLEQAKAMRVVLHVYPVTRDIEKAAIVFEATLEAEVRDDRIQMEEVLTVYNLGRQAWQPDDVTMNLPAGFTAFGAQTSMSDQGVDQSASGAKLRGTFSPGRGTVDFRWQLPWSGDPDVDFEIGLPPHVAIARVLMPASGDIRLAAGGFPPPEARRDSRGQKFLITERHARPDDPALASLSVGIRGLPSSGPGRILATGLSACGVVAGFAVVFSRRRLRASPKRARSAILNDLVSLERARAAGDVGPKTYERARRRLINVLAETFRET